MAYARLEDFDSIIKALAHDNTTGDVNLSTAEVLATMSVMLAAFANSDLPPDTQALVLHVARIFSAELIDRYAFSEGYVDFLFGAALMGRSDFWK